MVFDITTSPGRIIRKWNEILDSAIKKINDPNNFQIIFSEIDRVKNIFNESIDKMIKDLDEASQKVIKDLDIEISRLENVTQSVENVATRVQLIVNILPGAKTVPQVSNVTPSLIDKEQLAPNVTLNIQGNFPAIADLEPTLTMNNMNGTYPELTSVGKSTIKLQFLVPKEQVIEESSINSIQHKFGILTIKKPGMLFGNTIYDFKILFTVIPSSPGPLRITKIATQTMKESRLKSSLHCQEIDKEAEHHNKSFDHHLTPTDNTWKFDPKTVKVVLRHANGKYSIKNIMNTESELIFNVSSNRKHLNCGSVSFNIQAIEFRNTIQENRDEETLDLKWGNSITRDLSNNTRFIVTLDSFDGKHNEYTEVGTYPFLNITRNVNGQLRIEVKSIDAIKI